MLIDCDECVPLRIEGVLFSFLPFSAAFAIAARIKWNNGSCGGIVINLWPLRRAEKLSPAANRRLRGTFPISGMGLQCNVICGVANGLIKSFSGRTIFPGIFFV